MKYNELTPKAQEKAREWMTLCMAQDWSADDLLDEIEQAAGWLGITVATVSEHYSEGRVVERPDFTWSGFYSQGDGFTLRGRWDAANVDMAALVNEYPKDQRLHALAARAVALVLRYPVGEAQIANIRYGPGLPMMDVVCADESDESGFIDADAEKTLLEIVRDFCSWCFDQLQNDYEHYTGDDNATEAIMANDYEFSITGEVV